MKPDNKIKKASASYRAQKAKIFPVIGIGGSAGSFPAFEKFFNHMPSDSGMAFVIVMHLDPHHKGQLTHVMQQYTRMPVVEAEDGMPLEPNKVFLIPPNKDLGLHNRKLLLLQPTETNGYRQPIDYFLQSLADDQWNKAVAIILSGMGSDGETGVRMIKEKLGMAMVQDPDTAQYSSMPLASIGTNLVDYVLAPEEMPLKLIQYINHPVMVDESSEQARSVIQDAHSIQKILMLLRSHTGHDFSLYKKSTITRRIDRRIAFHQLPDYVTYVNYLRENPDEVDVLFNELLIGVTKFFRDAPAFDSLKQKIALLLHAKKQGDPVRVWLAGCSTGEEAYSVAMILMECLDVLKLKKLPKIQIFATDLDTEAIEHARGGNYHDNIVADVSPERINRFFVKKDGGYTVKKELREMIVFAQHNLIKDAPFTRLDLLCCRNVMIYLTTELQRKIIPIFYYALNPKGIMLMGPAETIGGFTEMFTALDAKWKMFERRDGGMPTGKMFDFPFHVAKTPLAISRNDDSEKMSGPAKRSISETYNRILLESYTPASVLVNEKGDILYSSGKTGRYLELPAGEAVMNIHKMAREELKYIISNIIHQAQQLKEAVVIPDVRLKEDDRTRLIDLRASLLDAGEMQGLVLIVFDDKGLLKNNNRKGKPSAPADRQFTEELEKELVYTKQQLNSTIEQMETSLEELKATNEELQSTNEELQSTNEESLTTKEEMQSLNEELMTINIQYQNKAEELTRLNNDMKNLLDATEIGTIFLDNQLDILRYTPQVRKLFNLIPTDIGRPITHVVSNFDHPDMEQDIRMVIDQLTTRELEVKTKTNEWYKVRIMPYRTLDNFISGAVLTFSLITPYKQLEFQFNAISTYLLRQMKQQPDAAVLLNNEFKIGEFNDGFLSLFQLKNTQAQGHLLSDLFSTVHARELVKEWLRSSSLKSTGEQLLIDDTTQFKDGPLTLTASRISEDAGGNALLIAVNLKKEGK